jgi:hypothetical protein
MNFPGVVESRFMFDEIYIGGARYLPAWEIARTHGYVRDYVARLCREGKVAGHQLGRLWYVDTDSFASFVRRPCAARRRLSAQPCNRS